jgi:K+-transporting ATPase KdpF subunit
MAGMSHTTVIVLIITVATLIYLVITLLYPEKF